MNKAVSLVGAGVGATIIQALPGHRVLTVTVAMTSSTRIANMTLQGGDAGFDSAAPSISPPRRSLCCKTCSSPVTPPSRAAASWPAPHHSGPCGAEEQQGHLGYGGGMLAFGAVVATDSVFQANTIITGGSGGGLMTYGGFNGTNVSFLSNTVHTVFGLGGGLVANGPLKINGGLFLHNRMLGGRLGRRVIYVCGWSYLRHAVHQ